MNLEEAKKLKHLYNTVLVVSIALVELVLLGLIILISKDLTTMETKELFESLYRIVAIDLILIWTGILVGYYTWAIYFYNINLGLTHEDWAEIRMKKERGEPVEEPTENPNKDKTLGLPDGTIRGTLALSLAVGALAMLIASFGIDNRMGLNELFIDTFDFFKTAFLMMVAFYFGNKSLQYLNYGAGPVKGFAGRTGQGSQPAFDGVTTPEPEPVPGLKPTPNPEAAAIRDSLNRGTDSPEDISSREDAKRTGDFDKPNANG